MLLGKQTEGQGVNLGKGRVAFHSRERIKLQGLNIVIYEVYTHKSIVTIEALAVIRWSCD